MSRICSKRFRIAVVIVIVVGICVVISSMKNNITIEKFGNNKICATPYCAEAAKYLIESIDETVDPCEDFYQFACGTWIKNNRTLDDSTTLDLLRRQLDDDIVDILTSSSTNDTNEPKALINARNLYRSCINEQHIEDEGINPILLLITNELGGWPIMQSSWDDSTFNLSNLLLKLRQYGYNIIFGIGTSIDDMNWAKYVLTIGRGDLGLGKPEYYMSESKLTMAYRRYMFDLASILSSDTLTIEQDVNDVYKLEKELAKCYRTTGEQQQRPNATIRTTVGQLRQLLHASFDFTNYLTSAYASAGVTLMDSDIVIVEDIDSLYCVSSIIEQVSPRILQNYVISRFMMDLNHKLPKQFQNIKENLNHAVGVTTTERARAVFEMVANIIKAFIKMLENSSWMDSMSKTKAIEKALAIDVQIGYPDYLASDNVTQLEIQYADYVFDSSIINNILKILQIKAKEEFQLLRKHVDRKAWDYLPPTTVNA
ncbi:unnamed protein product, partial [Adineta steineri]